MDFDAKRENYRELRKRLDALVEGENDPISLMATIVCELHFGLPHFHWTGFYRVTEPRILKIGPYQGSHGCLVIPFERGVCGAAAREVKVLRVDDVESFPGHIACSSTTQSEIVVPVFNKERGLIAVLDVDSDWPGSFDEVDEAELVSICEVFAR